MRASALFAADPGACRAALTALLEAHPGFREADILLIACALRLGDAAEAAAGLAGLLARQAPPNDPGFHAVADQVARATGAPGWLGVSAAGLVTLSRVAPGSRGIELACDGTRLALPRGGTIARVVLPEGWRERRELTARLDGEALIGHPLALPPFAAAEGVVEYRPDEGVSGWAWHRADPDQPVALLVEITGASPGAREVIRIEASDERTGPAAAALDRHRLFALPPDALPASGTVRVTGPDGRDLAGSPLQLGREMQAARAAAADLARIYPADGGPLPPATSEDRWRPLDTALLPVARGVASGAAPDAPGRMRPIDVVIPVYRGAADFAACLATLKGQLPRHGRIVVVDDASPDAALTRELAAAESAGTIHVLRHATNLGFPAAANTGLRFAAAGGPRDVLLLNADTLLPRDAIRRLARAAYSAGDVGSVTPMTNDGTILSYPGTRDANPIPDLAGTRRLDAAFRTANGDDLVDLPTAVGFCMFVRHDCLAATGLLREDVFARGYGEENDWCLRAAHLGWRHVAAAGVFVAHVGGQSFGGVKPHLIARNLRILGRLHPGYAELIEGFVARDPLARVRRAADRVLWAEGRMAGGAVVLVTHDRGGGVARHVRERAAEIRARGLRPIVLQPGKADGAACRVIDPGGESFENLEYGLPDELPALAALLREDRPTLVELHHTIGHAPGILDLAELLGVRVDVYVHDYALWCPRVTLLSHGDRYCGEPARIEECEACVADLGGRIREEIGVADLRARSAAVLRVAREVIAPSQDAAKRVRRHFPATRPVARAWEDDAALARLVPLVRRTGPPGPGERARIVTPGAIGTDKGYEVLLACARDAARRDLPLEFVVVGHTSGDERLLDSGRAFVTGRYAEAEAADLVRAQGGALGFIPSVWPETWCYALSLAWRAGLRVAAFDIGAQAERIRRANAGTLIPLGLPASRVNDLLVALVTGPV